MNGILKVLTAILGVLAVIACLATIGIVGYSMTNTGAVGLSGGIRCVAQRLPDGCGGTAERQSVWAGPHGEWSHQQYASNDGFHAVGLYRHPDGCQRCTE